MEMPLKEFLGQWKQLKPTAFTAGLQTKTPLDHDATMKGLSRIAKEFPELSESRFDKEKEKFILENSEADTDKQVYFRLTGSRKLELTWGALVEFDFQSQMMKLFNSIQDGFGVYPINVELIEVMFHVTSQWEGHHYRAILEAFLSNTTLGSLFEPKRILQDDLFLRGMLDDARTCVVSIESNVRDSEILKDSFKNDLLKVSVGVAQTRKIPVDAKISDVFTKHSRVALNFIREKFIPGLVDPLDKILIKLSEEER